MQHTQPHVKEDGRRCTFRAVVSFDGRQFRISAQLIENDRGQVIASSLLIAPSPVECNSYLLKDKDMPPPSEPVVGFGSAGGTVTVHKATIAPQQTSRRR